MVMGGERGVYCCQPTEKREENEKLKHLRNCESVEQCDLLPKIPCFFCKGKALNRYGLCIHLIHKT